MAVVLAFKHQPTSSHPSNGSHPPAPLPPSAHVAEAHAAEPTAWPTGVPDPPPAPSSPLPAFPPLSRGARGGVYALLSALVFLGLSLERPEAAGFATLGGGALGYALHCMEGSALGDPSRAADGIPRRVVITGGSRGLGRALARAFLAAGDKVLLTSRDAAAAAAAAAAVSAESGAPPASAAGAACDVSDSESVESLVTTALASMGGVDVWVCNAGDSGGCANFLESDPGTLARVAATNLAGGLLCSHAALRLFLAQGSGQLFLLEGAGSDGAPTPMYAAYGSTKAALRQLGRSLHAELAASGAAGAVGVHTVSPGMVLTDLLLAGATAPAKQAFNALCEQPEDVAAFLVPRLRTATGSGGHVAFLTPLRAAGRVLSLPARRGRFFDASGVAVYPPEADRITAAAARGREAREAARFAWDRARVRAAPWVYASCLAVAYVALRA